MPSFHRAFLVALLLAAPTAHAADTPQPATITVSTEGVVRATPDIAVVTAGVVTEAADASAALGENSTAMRDLIAAVAAAGVAEKDIGTSGFSIEPVTVYPQPKSDGTQDPPRITGYRVSNLVTVKIRDIAKAGGLLDAVVKIGANSIHGISFTVDDRESLLDDARAKAMKEAVRRAGLYAEAGGFTVGRIVSVSEGVGYMPQPAPYARVAMAAKEADSVPLSPGEQEIQASVSVTFEITQGQ